MARSKDQMTLDRILSRYGLTSRRSALEVIRAGRIKVNGRVVRDPNMWVNRETDAVHLDGKRLRRTQRTTLLFYKPKGVLTSHGDRRGRKTIYDCLDPGLPWLAPVGRLDMDTSGLILLTNDTEFANYVTSPDSEVPKTYLVKANTLLDDARIEELARGFTLKNGQTAKPRNVRRQEDRGKYTWLEIVLTEGKNREIHRLLENYGLTVLKLVRIRIGPCTTEGLEVGRWRRLSGSEIAGFYTKTTETAPDYS